MYVPVWQAHAKKKKNYHECIYLCVIYVYIYMSIYVCMSLHTNDSPKPTQTYTWVKLLCSWLQCISSIAIKYTQNFVTFMNIIQTFYYYKIYNSHYVLTNIIYIYIPERRIYTYSFFSALTEALSQKVQKPFISERNWN